MITSPHKISVVIISLILLVSVVTVGCGKKKEGAWVNTASMPGHAFDSGYSNLSSEKNNVSGTVYLGDPNTPDVQFGPGDVSFNFRDLR